MPTPLVYSVAEAAEALGISEWLAYRLVDRGELPSVRLGDRRLVVPRKALEELLSAPPTPGSPRPGGGFGAGREAS